jgi:hypothetical protein
VAIAGDTIVVGAPGNAPGPEMSDAGAAYVFVRGGSGDQFRSPGLLADGPSWSQQAKLVASDGAAGDSFGMAVAINGDTIVVGAPGHDPDPGSGSLPAGQAYVFERSAGSWAEKAKLVGGAGPQAAGDAFGFSVAVASGGGGKTVVVGAPFFHKTTAGPSIGRAFVFVGAGTSWTRQANLSPADGRSGDAFGFSVAISSNTVIVGAPAHDPGDKPLAGQAYVFVRSGSVWSLQSTLRASNGAAGDLFGLAVDVSLDAAVVGAPVRDTSAGTSSGQAYVFGRSGATWSQQAILDATRPAPQQFFGFGVAVDNRTVVVGAPFHDASDGAGPTYVFAPAQFLAAVWTGLKNSDDVGLRLDLKITAVVAGSPVVGEVDNIAPGGAGFSNAILQAVPLALTGSVLPSSVTVAARVSCFGAGHSTGVARLWYNGRSVDSGLLRDAGSRVELPTGRSFLVNGFVLRSTPGASQKSIDRALTSAVACDAPGGRPFTSFGTWTAPLH